MRRLKPLLTARAPFRLACRHCEETRAELVTIRHESIEIRACVHSLPRLASKPNPPKQ